MPAARKRQRKSKLGLPGADAAALPSMPVTQQRQRESNLGRAREMAAQALAIGIGICLAALLLSGRLRPPVAAKGSQIVVGTRDKIYYFRPATADVARALGEALKSIGYLTDNGAVVTLSKGAKGAVVSFRVKEGAWNKRDTLLRYEGIGGHIAAPLGGYPVRIRLTDAKLKPRREIVVGRIFVVNRDQIYYCGSATEAEASALGRVLIAVHYLTGLGTTVVLSKEDATMLSFVVNEAAWTRPEAFAAMQSLVRGAAASVGGLPVTLRLVNREWHLEREAQIQ
jgi:hypothetical protein